LLDALFLLKGLCRNPSEPIRHSWYIGGCCRQCFL